MMVASIETTLELWASTLRDVKRRMRGLFAQERSAVNAELFLDGLLGGSKPFWAVTAGRLMRCVTWYATMSLSIWPTRMRCL